MADFESTHKVEVVGMSMRIDSDSLLRIELSDAQLKKLAEYLAVELKKRKYE